MINEIKQAFPNPSQSKYNIDYYCDGTRPCNICYCVGGAFLLFRNSIRCEKELESALPSDELNRLRLPTRGRLAHAISKFNNKIPYFRAHYLAGAIIDANDTGRFNEAWNLLDFALSTNGEPLLLCT